ncbi:MAG: hypothetical protein M1541_05825 [Acidobacteria bacterium]|nr:hypothetical protein [Acidobacteriota bacterium]
MAYYASDMVDQLDLSAIHAVYEKELRGQPPYDPRMLTKGADVHAEREEKLIGINLGGGE